jgi:hypothetical protein
LEDHVENQEKLVCVAIILGMILVGCTSSTQQSQPPTPVPNTQTVTTEEMPESAPTDSPAPPTSKPTQALISIDNLSDLAGTWLKSAGGFDSKLDVKPSGEATFRLGLGLGTRVVEIWFEDGLLHFKEDPWPECPDGAIGIYETSGIPGEVLKFSLVDDPCVSDRGLRGTWTEASAP